MHAVGADARRAAGAGPADHGVDAGLDLTHPEFSSRPNTSVFNMQTTVGDVDFHGTAVSSVAAAPANGVGVVGTTRRPSCARGTRAPPARSPSAARSRASRPPPRRARP